MKTVGFENGENLGSASIAEGAEPSPVVADWSDLASTKILLRKALAREEALRRERDQLIKQRDIVTNLFAGREVAVARLATLTSRQRQIMVLVLLGHQNKRIAAEIGISQRTVESHRASIMKRTGATCLPELVRLSLVAERLTEKLADQSVFSSRTARSLNSV
jgi:DNA-binding NarL/FixJ family response regulator